MIYVIGDEGDEGEDTSCGRTARTVWFCLHVCVRVENELALSL